MDALTSSRSAARLDGSGSSFVIITSNRYEELMRGLESLGRQTVKPREVVLVDAGSDPRVHPAVQEMLERERIGFVYLQSVPGTSRQRNLGVKHASGDLVFFIDDDVVLESGYHEAMLRAYRELVDQPVGGIQGTIVNERRLSRGEILLRRIFLLRHPVRGGRARMLSSGNFTWFPHPPRLVRIECMTTACCSYPREVLQQFGFDEALDGYAFKEDVDLAYRVSRVLPLYQTPHARLQHLRSTKRVSIREKNAKRVANTIYLWRKNLPHTPRHVLALGWSLVGFFVLSIGQAVASRSLAPVQGTLGGLLSIPGGGSRHPRRKVDHGEQELERKPS